MKACHVFVLNGLLHGCENVLVKFFLLVKKEVEQLLTFPTVLTLLTYQKVHNLYGKSRAAIRGTNTSPAIARATTAANSTAPALMSNNFSASSW